MPSPIFAPPSLLSPLDSALSRLDDSIRVDLRNIRDEYFVWLLILAGLVAIGVILEGPEIIQEIRHLLDRLKNWGRTRLKLDSRSGMPIAKKEHKLDRVKLFGALGWALVSVGVGGEFVCDKLVSDADALLQHFNEILLTETQRETARANERAGNALMQAASADAHTLREIAARLALEKQLLWAGPRFLFVQAAHADFNRYLKRFNGQNAIVTACGGQFFSRGDQEIMLTAGSLNMALKEAGWKVDNLHPPTIDQGCPTIGEGVSVNVSSEASKGTKDAATKLVAVIDKVLRQITGVIPLNPTVFKLNGAPLAPETIEIAVRMHPMVPTGPGIEDERALKDPSTQ